MSDMNKLEAVLQELTRQAWDELMESNNAADSVKVAKAQIEADLLALLPEKKKDIVIMKGELQIAGGRGLYEDNNAWWNIGYNAAIDELRQAITDYCKGGV